MVTPIQPLADRFHGEDLSWFQNPVAEVVLTGELLAVHELIMMRELPAEDVDQNRLTWRPHRPDQLLAQAIEPWPEWGLARPRECRGTDENPAEQRLHFTEPFPALDLPGDQARHRLVLGLTWRPSDAPVLGRFDEEACRALKHEMGFRRCSSVARRAPASAHDHQNLEGPGDRPVVPQPGEAGTTADPVRLETAPATEAVAAHLECRASGGLLLNHLEWIALLEDEALALLHQSPGPRRKESRDHHLDAQTHERIRPEHTARESGGRAARRAADLTDDRRVVRHAGGRCDQERGMERV